MYPKGDGEMLNKLQIDAFIEAVAPTIAVGFGLMVVLWLVVIAWD